MPIYMETHTPRHGWTSERLLAAHLEDHELQDKYAVKPLRCWWEGPEGRVFCLVEAPSPEAVRLAHQEIYGLEEGEIVQLKREWRRRARRPRPTETNLVA